MKWNRNSLTSNKFQRHSVNETQQRCFGDERERAKRAPHGKTAAMWNKCRKRQSAKKRRTRARRRERWSERGEEKKYTSHLLNYKRWTEHVMHKFYFIPTLFSVKIRIMNSLRNWMEISSFRYSFNFGRRVFFPLDNYFHTFSSLPSRLTLEEAREENSRTYFWLQSMMILSLGNASIASLHKVL